MCEEVVNDAVSWYCESVEASTFDIDIGVCLSVNTQFVQYGHDEYVSEPDLDAAIEAIESDIKDTVEKEIDGVLNDLPGDLRGGLFVAKPYKISIDGINNLVNGYLRSDDDDDRYRYLDYEPNSSSDIDLIFSR